MGDELLSLDEAIRIAHGTLDVAAMSAAEQAQVEGTPGPDSADLIQVALGSAATITSPPSDPKSSAVSIARRNTGDTLDGGGATITSLVPTGIGLLLASSDFTVRNLRVEGFTNGIYVDFGGATLRDVTFSDVDVVGSVIGGLTVAARSSNGSLRGLRIVDSTFDGRNATPTGTANGVVLAAANTVGDGVISTALLEDVLFARNQVIGGLTGLYVYGAVGAGGAVDNALTRNVQVLDNSFSEQGDAPLNIAGAIPVAGAAFTDSGVDDVVIARNSVVAQTRGYGIWVGAGEAVAGATVERAHVRNVAIRHNAVTGVPGGERRQCVMVEVGRSDHTALAHDHEVSDVRITDNQISDCDKYAVAIHAGASAGDKSGGGGSVQRNIAEDIVIHRNDIRRSTLGVSLRGMYAPMADAPQPSLGAYNVVRDISIMNNRFTETPTAISMIAGEAVAPGVITANEVSQVVIGDNRMLGPGTPCIAMSDSGIGSFDNRLLATCGL